MQPLLNPSIRATVLLCVLIVVLTQSLSWPTALGAPAASPARPLATLKKGSDGAPMVLIPAGSFVMGSEDGHEDERPPHGVTLPAFYLDMYEVTVDRYIRFIKAVNAERPMAWREATAGAHGDKPVVGIDWFDAKEYCEWAGRRLPTEAEWEKAARGNDSRRYPWGDETPSPAHANFNRARWDGYSTVSPVGSHPKGQSPYGIHDLAGNVWEWVADRYEQHYYAESPSDNPTGPATGPLRVLRGGSWSNTAEIIRASNRGGYPPTAHRSDFGFRCAADAAR